MPKDLNDAIDAIFRGIVFICYNYVYSIASLALKPLRASFRLVHRLRSGNVYQTRPYVFMFMSFFIALALPRYYLQLVNVLRIQYIDTDQGPVPDTTLLNDIYRRALDIFEPKFLLAISISCIVMCILVDGATNVCVSALCAKRVDQRLFKDALFYVIGFQAVLVCAVLVIVFSRLLGLLWSPNEEFSQARFIDVILKSATISFRLEHGWRLWFDVCVAFFTIVMLVYALAQPSFVIRVFAQKRLRSVLKKYFSPRGVVWLSTGALAICMVVFFQIGNFVADQIRPTQALELAISEVTCVLSKNPDQIKAVAIIANNTRRAFLLRPFDFHIKLRKWEKSKRAGSSGDSSGTYLVKPINTVISNARDGVKPAYALRQDDIMWVEVTATQSFSDFLKEKNGRDSVDCGVSTVGSLGQELQRYGGIVDADIGD